MDHNGFLRRQIFRFWQRFKIGKTKRQAVDTAEVALGLKPKLTVVADNDDSEEQRLWKVIATNHCPDCGGEGFWEGPSGGMSVNIMCVHCQNRFNVTPIIERAARI